MFDSCEKQSHLLNVSLRLLPILIKGTYIAFTPLWSSNPFLLWLGQSPISSPQGRFGFFKATLSFDVFIGHALLFPLDQEGVLCILSL